MCNSGDLVAVEPPRSGSPSERISRPNEVALLFFRNLQPEHKVCGVSVEHMSHIAFEVSIGLVVAIPRKRRSAKKLMQSFAEQQALQYRCMTTVLRAAWYRCRSTKKAASQHSTLQCSAVTV